MRLVDPPEPIDLLNQPTVLLYHSASFTQSPVRGGHTFLPTLLPLFCRLSRPRTGDWRDGKTRGLECGTVPENAEQAVATEK